MARAGLPVLTWFLRRRQTVRLFLFCGLLFLVFFSGKLEILGLSQSETRLMAGTIIPVIFGMTFINTSQSRKPLSGLLSLLAFVGIGFLSAIASKTNLG
jgi:hypothetical protein